MVKRIFAYLIPVVILGLIVYVFNSGESFKEPRGEGDQVEVYILQLQEDLLQENWHGANDTLSALEQGFGRIVPRVQFSVERGDITEFEKSLARVRGSILAKDKAGALRELSEANFHWNTLGK